MSLKNRGAMSFSPHQLCSPLSYKDFFISQMGGLTQIIGISRMTLFLVIWVEMKVSNPYKIIYTFFTLLFLKLIRQQRITSSKSKYACGLLNTGHYEDMVPPWYGPAAPLFLTMISCFPLTSVSGNRINPLLTE